MVKTNGAEFKRFYRDAAIWPDEVWHDDELVLVDGVEWDHPDGFDGIPDNAMVNLSEGGIYGLPGDREMSFESYFRAWRKRQTTSTLLVECDLAKLDAIKLAVKAAGGRVR